MASNFIDDLNRASVLIMMVLVGVLSFMNNISLTFVIKYLLNGQINYFLKQGFKYVMGDDEFPIIGTGTRPNGAINCGNFRDNFFDKNIVPGPTTSYGFPSGHAQSCGFFATFIHSYFRHNPLIYYPFILYSLYIPYTRLEFGCHTIQQVIFGYICGIIFYYILEHIHNLMISVKNSVIYYFRNRDEINKKNK